LFVVFSVALVRLEGSSPPVRRFWRWVTASGVLFTAADVWQLGHTVVRPDYSAAVGGTVQTAFVGAGVLCTVIGMLTYPIQVRGRERLRWWFDAVTIMVGVAAFAWTYLIRSGRADVHLGVVLLSSGVMLVCAFGLIKLLLAGQAPFTRAAGITGGTAAGLTGVLTALAFQPADPLTLDLGLVVRLIPVTLVTATPRIQQVQLRADPDGLARRWRPYSRLPYVAVAFIQVLLVVVLLGGQLDLRAWGVVAGAILCTTLVVVRQLLAFSDNARLLTEANHLREELHHEATHDPLTGLANRTLFDQRVSTGDPADRIAIMMIDLDDFKTINDTLGHPVGDNTLAAVSNRLARTVRSTDTVARMGGDEFAILLPDVEADVALAVVQRVQAAIAQPIHLNGHRLDAQASIGFAVGPRQEASELLRRADSAMYAVKQTGKGRYAAAH
jgi:diguanylate cyclase (GGDEF)-like protein